MINKLVFASKNKGKIREVEHLLSTIGIQISTVPDDFDVIENGKTFLENAIIKATEAAKVTCCDALADDSGLIVDALDGRPGVLSSRYAENDTARINKILHEMSDVPDEKRSARFVCAIALVSPEGKPLFSAQGKCEGTIIKTPKGSDGFGYDPIFLVKQLGCTMAEIPLDIKNSISHRAVALNKLLSWLSSEVQSNKELISKLY